jgi:transposase
MKSKFSEEYKAEAVRLVLEQGLAPAQAARDLGIGLSTLDKWVRAKRSESRPVSQPELLTENERAELKRLRKEVSVLRMERDILKKATAFFSKSSLPEVSGS